MTLVAFTFATIVSATQIPKVGIHPLHSKQIIVTTVNNGVFDFEISIYAKNGDIVYYKQSEKPISTYQKIFDVKDLVNGVYTMKLNVNGISLEKDFSVTSKKIYVHDLMVDIEPYFSFDGKDLKFSYLNTKMEKFNVEIFTGNELVYKEKIGNQFPINSGYNLSKLETGNYRLVLSSPEKEFEYQFMK